MNQLEGNTSFGHWQPFCRGLQNQSYDGNEVVPVEVSEVFQFSWCQTEWSWPFFLKRADGLAQSFASPGCILAFADFLAYSRGPTRAFR